MKYLILQHKDNKKYIRYYAHPINGEKLRYTKRVTYATIFAKNNTQYEIFRMIHKTIYKRCIVKEVNYIGGTFHLYLKP